MPRLAPHMNVYLLFPVSNKRFEQGYIKECLKSSFRMISGQYREPIKYEIYHSKMLDDILKLDHIQWHLNRSD